MNAKDENTSAFSSSKQMIFRIKKLQRKGLLEKKEMLRTHQLSFGKWTKEEEDAFFSSCFQYGPNWNLIKNAVKTRTKSQIRSHAQKYMIKLCKLYDIPIKSKKKKPFNKKDLNFPYGRKKRFEIKTIDDMSQEELKYLQEFNFYLKDFDVFFDQYTEMKEVQKESAVKPSPINIETTKMSVDANANTTMNANTNSSDLYKKQVSDYIMNELSELIKLNNELFEYLLCNDL